MARDKTAREPDEEASLLDRRGYLRLAGAAAASVAGMSTASAAASSSQGALLREDFSTADYTSNFTSTWRQGQYDERVSSPVKSGSNSLCVDIPSGNHYGIASLYDPVEAGDVDSEVTELYASYWVRFSSDFQADGNVSKIPGPANTEPGGGKGGEPSNGTNGWSARGGFTDRGGDIGIGYYCYHMDMDGQYGDYFHAATVTGGEWVKVDQYIKLNSVSGGNANSDGELKMWIDDELKVDRSGMRFTEDLSIGVNYSFNVYFGGGSPSPQDQSVYIDSWALNTNQRPAMTDGTQTSQPSNTDKGTVLELVSSDGMPTTQYQFTVDGTVSKRTSADRNSSEDNDSVTDNGDGTMTVTGATGNGYGDSYLVDGAITSVTGIDESKWTIRYGGSEVSVDELTAGPAVDSFDVSKSETLGDDRMFSVNWSVSDPDGNLDTVEVVVVKNGLDMNFAVTDVNGPSASGWDLFQFPIGTELDVNLRVTDSAGNVTEKTRTVTL
ncbi:polysaccharide lyase [Halorussus sp. AFM4]|uniref:polysaccharide lyase n=1 Tax=Halorussus sp. AFM4 TaxID=3421651 RepID=UPI003EB9E094